MFLSEMKRNGLHNPIAVKREVERKRAAKVSDPFDELLGPSAPVRQMVGGALPLWIVPASSGE
jgi:hypothetical protein